ncbi:MAG TPA: hypothetical protein VHK69_14050 [Chitinophagaceae bacterium]|nr:hypothetical protein [Chitinophagaceae bacterium]
MMNVTRVVLYVPENKPEECSKVDQYLMQGFLISGMNQIGSPQSPPVTQYVLEKRESRTRILERF